VENYPNHEVFAEETNVFHFAAAISVELGASQIVGCDIGKIFRHVRIGALPPNRLYEAHQS